MGNGFTFVLIELSRMSMKSKDKKKYVSKDR